MRYIGMDVGFGYSKAMDETKTIIFPSIVSPAVKIMFRSGLEDPSSRLDHLNVTLDGATCFVGELARRQGRFAHATIDRVRTHSQEYRLLFLTALALGTFGLLHPFQEVLIDLSLLLQGKASRIRKVDFNHAVQPPVGDRVFHELLGSILRIHQISPSFEEIVGSK